MNRHVMSVLVEDNPLSFNRVSGLLARKGYQIEKLIMGRTGNSGVFRMTFTVESRDWTLNQLNSQLEKLADVIRTEPGREAFSYERAAIVRAK